VRAILVHCGGGLACARVWWCPLLLRGTGGRRSVSPGSLTVCCTSSGHGLGDARRGAVWSVGLSVRTLRSSWSGRVQDRRRSGSGRVGLSLPSLWVLVLPRTLGAVGLPVTFRRSVVRSFARCPVSCPVVFSLKWAGCW